jgi:hypothetical protein
LLERLVGDFRVVAERKGITLTYISDQSDARIFFDEYCLMSALSRVSRYRVQVDQYLLACGP